MCNQNSTEHPPILVVRHTASSRLFGTDPLLKDTIEMIVKEIWQPSTRDIDACRQFGNSNKPAKASFTLVNAPGAGMFEHLAKHLERAKGFRGAMKWNGTFESQELKYLVNGCSQDLVNRPGAVLVDVGGAQGAVVDV